MAELESLTLQESVSYQGNLKKKIGKNNWKCFNVVLKENILIFCNPSDGSWAGKIELDERSTCNLCVKGSRIEQEIQDPTINTEIAELNRRKSRGENIKFSLQTKRGVHLLKADTQALCLDWIRVLRRAVMVIREKNYSKHSPYIGKNRGLNQGNNNQIYRDLYVYHPVEAEDSESEGKQTPGRRFRSRSCHEQQTRDWSFNLIKRSRFRSLRKLSRNYENLKDTCV